jgi:hypothetical protein
MEERRRQAELVAAMAHELRSPLNVILGYADLLLDGEFGDLEDAQRTVLTRMQQSARELLDMIGATLELGRREAGIARQALAHVAVAELFADLEADARAALGREGVEVRWDLAPALPALETDGSTLRLALKHALRTAIKQSEGGTVTVAAVPADGAIVLTVTAAGEGPRRPSSEVWLEVAGRLLRGLGGHMEIGPDGRIRMQIPVHAAAADAG